MIALAFIAGMLVGASALMFTAVVVAVARKRRLSRQIAADLKAVFDRLLAASPVHPTCACDACVERRRAETRN